MYRIELDPFYEFELEQILISIITDYTLDYAEKIVVKIDEKIEQLKHFPKCTRFMRTYLCTENLLLSKNIRYFIPLMTVRN